VVDFGNSDADYPTPEAYIKKCIETAIAKGIFSNDTKARVIHWPADNYPESREAGKEIVDDLITGVRTGNF
jgi:hypothetical protein